MQRLCAGAMEQLRARARRRTSLLLFVFVVPRVFVFVKVSCRLVFVRPVRRSRYFTGFLLPPLRHGRCDEETKSKYGTQSDSKVCRAGKARQQEERTFF